VERRNHAQVRCLIFDRLVIMPVSHHNVGAILAGVE
jgi:hypothetical protein